MHDPKTGQLSALEIEHVSHRYGARQALSDVSLAVAPASFTVLLGLNGAGKSTLFSLITRLYATQAGHIRIFGHDMRQQPGEALRLLGIVFQSRALDPDLSVMRNLAYHAALHGIGTRQASERATQVLARVSLADRAKEVVRNLSGGQMRRVEIARALLHRPKLLLLDEPTVGLDIRARADILDHVRQLLLEERIGVLWATHLIDEVDSGDDVVVLHTGRVLASGPVAKILAETGTADIRAAFSKLTRADAGDDGSQAA
jgi:ABC-2 type transport system ATP-binding protein